MQALNSPKNFLVGSLSESDSFFLPSLVWIRSLLLEIGGKALPEHPKSDYNSSASNQASNVNNVIQDQPPIQLVQFDVSEP